MFTKQEFAKMIDQAVLKANVTKEDVIKACEVAKKYKFAALFVNSCWVPLAAEQLKGSGVRVGTQAGFPLGASSTEAKVAEAKKAIEDGADEIDMVINIGALKSRLYDFVEEDVKKVVETAKGFPHAEKRSIIVKLIIETCYLNDEEKIRACELGVKAGVDYIKTSTGFGTGGVKPGDIMLIKKAVQGRAGIKASGGIHSFSFAKSLIDMGATRIGTSVGEQLIQEMELKYI